MPGYSHLSDAEVISELSEYRASLKKVLGRQVAVVAGEGRRVEFIGQSGAREIRNEIRNLEAEASSRGLTDPLGGGSLGVEIG